MEPRAYQALLPAARVQTFDLGERIMTCGEEPPLRLLVEGHARAFEGGEGGVAVDVLPGQVLGEQAVFFQVRQRA